MKPSEVGLLRYDAAKSISFVTSAWTACFVAQFHVYAIDFLSGLRQSGRSSRITGRASLQKSLLLALQIGEARLTLPDFLGYRRLPRPQLVELAQAVPFLLVSISEALTAVAAAIPMRMSACSVMVS